MKSALIVGAFALGLGALALPRPAHAVTCANGVYRAGCAGPNGATTVHKYPAQPANRNVTCANGVYRAGCAGPNGAAVVRK